MGLKIVSFNKLLWVWQCGKMLKFINHFENQSTFNYICILNKYIMTAQNKRLSGILLTVGGLLIIPLVFMQFSNDVDWTLFDFMIAGLLLGGAGLLIELILRKAKIKREKVDVWCSGIGDFSINLDRVSCRDFWVTFWRVVKNNRLNLELLHFQRLGCSKFTFAKCYTIFTFCS
jgi:phosphoserine aminotransferase